MNATEGSNHQTNSAIFSSDQGGLVDYLTPVQKNSLIILLVTLFLVVWGVYLNSLKPSHYVAANQNYTAVSTGEGLDIQVTSPDQVEPKPVKSSNTSNSGAVNVQYSSNQQSTNGTASSSASLTVNGQEVPIQQNSKTRKVIESHSTNSSSTVVVNVDSQSSSSGQSGGSD